MKKAKLISAISLIMLCICMLSVGIIASAGSSNEKVGVGGVINVPENKIGVTVKAYIIQGVPTADQYSSAVTPDYDSSLTEPTKNEDKIITSCGETWEFTNEQLQKMTFNLSNANTEEDLAKVQVTIVFVVENKGTLGLETKFTINKDSDESLAEDTLTVEEDVNGQKQNINTVSVTFSNTNINANGTAACSIAFKPLRFVDQPKAVEFNYTLNVIEGTVGGGDSSES